MAQRNQPPPSGIDYDDETDTYTATYDWGGSDTPAVAVAQTVAAAVGRDPSRMRPLYEVVDLDALETVIDPSETEDGRPPRRVSFRFEGYRVAVSSDGQTAVSPVDDRPE